MENKETEKQTVATSDEIKHEEPRKKNQLKQKNKLTLFFF